MGPATLKDVARICGVSIATASRALNDKGEVNPETRKRVLAVAEELGYVPNSLAKGLWSGKTKIVGVLVTTIENPFYANVVSGIERVLSDYGYNILLSSSHEDPEREMEAVRVLLEQRVDGLVLAPVQSSPAVVEFLNKNRVPFVLVGRNIPDVDTNFVVCDDQLIGQMAAEHLIKKGHRKILFINSSGNHSARLRLQGYLNTMKKHGINVEDQWIREVRANETAKAILFKALDQGLEPTAIFCFCDHIAVEIVRGLYERGLKIPSDIAVLGVDNLGVTEITNPPLTTIDTQHNEMGMKTAEILLKVMENRSLDTSKVVLTPKLIERSSS
ncbi:MAG: LacI family transcriptional regulator [Firmicutes bacterium]|nr:LacI family transcriptional regulator [Bacillota bacterium]